MQYFQSILLLIFRFVPVLVKYAEPLFYIRPDWKLMSDWTQFYHVYLNNKMCTCSRTNIFQVKHVYSIQQFTTNSPKTCRRWQKTISFNLYRLPRENKYIISEESRWLQTNDSQELLIVFVSITEKLSYLTKIWNWILFKYNINNILFISRNWRDQCWVEKFFFVVEQTGISLAEVNHQRMVSFYIIIDVYKAIPYRMFVLL